MRIPADNTPAVLSDCTLRARLLHRLRIHHNGGRAISGPVAEAETLIPEIIFVQRELRIGVVRPAFRFALSARVARVHGALSRAFPRAVAGTVAVRVRCTADPEIEL
ncbi:hypothetical protein DPMN_031325 [Dreissena polymorpha]|uniref:Uncharacterized protein n=1 Tax=Dreissena polymorpha TaxID=45954 RepID=A0A9D4RJ74_DREPO|nr:hypothetical protein DPMN_031325 [Dreissena polymorpha]